MSKPQFRKIKRQLPSSSNLVLSNNAMLTSTWSKLLARVSTTSSYSNWFQVVSTNWYLNENWDVFSYNHSFYPSPSPPLPVFSSSSPSSCCYLVLVRSPLSLSLSRTGIVLLSQTNVHRARRTRELLFDYLRQQQEEKRGQLQGKNRWSLEHLNKVHRHWLEERSYLCWT